MHALRLLVAAVGVIAAPSPGSAASANDQDLHRRTGAVYKVKDLTGPDLTGQFQAGYTDLGIPQLTPDGRLFFLCGDTFASGVGGSNWRAPVGLYSSSTDLTNVKIDDSVGGASAVGLVEEGHAGGTTAIPSDVFTVNGKMYMNLMRGVIYKTDHSDFWVSEDSGVTWTYLNLWEGNMLGSAFQQKTFAVGDDDYVYCLSSVFNRDVVSDLLLHRIPKGSIEDASTWQPWGFADGAWAWGNAATTVASSRRWGEISWRNMGDGKFVFTFLNMEPLGIHYMVLDGPTGDMFAAQEQVLILPAADLASEHDNYVASPYGGFIFPGSTLASFDFAVSQWNGDTYRVMQFRADGI